MQSYHQTKREKPLTKEEIEEKIEETKEEMKEVLEWKKEEEEKLSEDKFKTPQAKSASKRNLKKAEKRVDQVKGMIDYWNNRKSGMSHFRASIELNEYWASLKEKERLKREAEEKLPRVLRKK